MQYVTELVPEYVIIPYISRVGSYLDRFKQVSAELYTFRCPYCGDSQKKKNKCRGYIYKKNNDYMMKCHNCGKVTGIKNFISDISSSLAAEMRLDIFKAVGSRRSNTHVTEVTVKENFSEFSGNSKKFTDILHKSHVPLSDVSVPELVTDYVKTRMLPQDELYYCENILDVLMQIEKYKSRLDENPNCYNHLTDKESVCIPYYSVSGQLTHLQYRFITQDNFRYLTVEVTESDYKIWGLHRINKENLVYVFEGAFDAMMVDNGVAAAQGDLYKTYEYLQGLGYTCVLVHDNDYCSNKQINKVVNAAITNSATVVIYDSEFSEKDANKMVTAHTWSKQQLQEYFIRRTYKGLKAKLEMTKQCSLNKPLMY